MSKTNNLYYTEVLTSLDSSQLKSLIDLEIDAFPGIGSVDEQTLVPISRYGKIVLFRETGDPRAIAVCELMRDYNQPNRAYVFAFYVRSDKKGTGIGGKFLHEILLLLKEDGFQTVCLTVDVNNTAAIKLYEKLGFITKLTREAEYGEGEDRYFMDLEL